MVGLLSFPVSFLQKNISVFSVQQLIRRMLLLSRGKRISCRRSRPSQGHSELGLGVEMEESDFHSYFPGAILPPEILSLVEYNNYIFPLCKMSHFSKVASHCTETESEALYWHSLGVTLEG